MRLDVRLFPLSAAGRSLLAEQVPGAAPVSGRFAIPIDDPGLPRILAAGDSHDGFWISGEARFSAAEISSRAWFEAVCRLVLPERRGDHELNAAAVAAAPLAAGGIRLPRGLVLSRASLRPNAVGSIGDWTQEYAVGSAVARLLADGDFSGVQLLPVDNPRTGGAHPDVRQLFSDSILPPAVVDCSIERIVSRFPEEHGALRHLGCLAYRREDLAGARDFNRTAEPWAGWSGLASWVVSARVRSLFKQSHLRGWAFRPVLTQDEPCYGEYVSQWQALVSLVAGTEHSRFDGGRW